MKTKKKVFTKHGGLLSPNSSGDQRSDADQSSNYWGDADADRTQIIPPYSNPPPPGFQHPVAVPASSSGEVETSTEATTNER